MDEILKVATPDLQIRIWNLGLSERYMNIGMDGLAAEIVKRGIESLENDPAYKLERQKLLNKGREYCALSGNFI